MNELVSILVVEDDATIRAILEMALLGAGFRHVRTAARGDDGFDMLRSEHFDLVLLDVMLPGFDGFSFARRMRETPSLADVRIIMITARTQPDDIVRGLEAGADDYVTKPFDRKVLLARINAVLRRGESLPQAESFDGLVIRPDAHEASLDGEDLHLSPGEFRILTLLAENRGRVLARRRILDAILPDDKAVTERTVDVQIATLRRKLGRWSDHVETVRGVGYRVKP